MGLYLRYTCTEFSILFTNEGGVNIAKISSLIYIFSVSLCQVKDLTSEDTTAYFAKATNCPVTSLFITI